MIKIDFQKETEINQSNTNQDFHAKSMNKRCYISKKRKLDQINKLKSTKNLLGVVTIQQYNLNAGLEKVLMDKEDAVKKQLSQLHGMNTFTPVDGSQLTREENKNAIISFMFLADKIDSSIKGRA